MAANTDVIAAGAVDLELEAMRKDDCSWHPCQVSFSQTGGGLVIKYENNESQDTLVSEKEALKRIRVRSLPLQDDDCAQIKPGEHVVVNRDSESERGFFDAEVEKVVWARHSKRTKCRCSFMIKWLHQDLNDGSLKVPSSSVMRLANKNINNHPTISAFIDSVGMSNSSDSDMSSEVNVTSDFDLDLDLHDLLERQIEGIRSSVHGPKKRIRDEIGFEGLNELSQKPRLNAEINEDSENYLWKCKEISKTKEVEASSEKSRSMSTRSQQSVKRGRPKKQATPSPVVAAPLMEEEVSEKKSPLNPLAARAALASLMSQLPKSIEITSDDKETKALESSETEDAPKPDKIVKKLFPSDSLEDDKMNDKPETRSTRAKVQKVKVKVKQTSVTYSRRGTPTSHGKQEETPTETDDDDDTSDHKVMANGSDAPKDENTLFTTPSLVENAGGKISSYMRVLLTRARLNKEAEKIETETIKEEVPGNDVKGRAKKSKSSEEESESKLSPLPTEQKKKKRNKSGATQDSEGMSLVKDEVEGTAKRSKSNEEETEYKLSPVPTEQKKKKRDTSGATQDSKVAGGVRSNNGVKKGTTLDLKSKLSPLPTEQKKKKRNKSGATQDSEGMSPVKDEVEGRAKRSKSSEEESESKLSPLPNEQKKKKRNTSSATQDSEVARRVKSNNGVKKDTTLELKKQNNIRSSPRLNRKN